MIVVEQHKMLNNTAPVPKGHPEIWASTILFCSMMLGFYIIFGFVFNTSFIVMMCHGKFVAKIRHMLYMNLIFVDIMLCLVWMPMKLSIVHTLFYYYHRRNLDQILAELNIYILMMSVAFLTVVFICIQKICQRTDILKMKQNGILVTIGLSLTWIISFIWMVVQNFVHGEVGIYYLVAENSTSTLQFYGKIHNDNTESVFTIIMLMLLTFGLSGLLVFAWKYRCKRTLYAPEIRIESIGPSTHDEPSRNMSISTNRNPSFSTMTDTLSEPRPSLRTASFSTTTDQLTEPRVSSSGTRNTSFSTTTTDLLSADPPSIVVTGPPAGPSHAPGGPKIRHLSIGEPTSPTKLRSSIIYVQETTKPLEIERHHHSERRVSAISTLPVITSEPLETSPKAVYYKQCPKYMDPTTYDYVQKWSVDVMALQSQLSNPVLHGGNSYPYEEGHSVMLSPSPRTSLDPNNPLGMPRHSIYSQRPSKADTGFHSLDSISVVEVSNSDRQPSIQREHTITYPFPKSPDTPNLTNQKKTVQELRCCMILLLTFLILLLPPLLLNLFQWQMDKSVFLNLHIWFVTLGGTQVLIHPFLITKMERSFKTYCLKCKQKLPRCQKREIVEHT